MWGYMDDKNKKYREQSTERKEKSEIKDKENT